VTVLAKGRARGATIVLTVVAYVLVAGLVFAADLWDPLGRSRVALVTLASFALGLVVGRFWAVAVVVLLVPLSLLAPWSDQFTLFLLALIGVPFEALVVAAGAVLRRLLDRRVAGAGPTAGAIAMATVLLAVGWGLYLDARHVDDAPSAPLLLDERTGTYRGLRVGASEADVIRLFGEGQLGDPGKGPAPLGVNSGQVSGPRSSPGGGTIFRYRDLAVMIRDGKVTGYVTTADNAETRAGVGVGDSLSVAEERYYPLQCEVVDLGNDEESLPAYPACWAKLATDVTFWLGNDPIDSIWVFA